MLEGFAAVQGSGRQMGWNVLNLIQFRCEEYLRILVIIASRNFNENKFSIHIDYSNNKSPQ